jgi:hypothetical protein
VIPTVSIRDALGDPRLLGNVLSGPSWKAWRALLIAAMGERLDDDERELFRQLTQRDHEPGQRVEEFVAVVGRRGGKSRAISVLATYIAGLCQHPALVRGEIGTLLIIAPDQRQAQIVLSYIEAAFDASPVLSQLIESKTQWELRLSNKVQIEVRASDFRRLRGQTNLGVICDESSYFHNEGSANPDEEILNACRPGLATTGGPLIMISSPYARRGELWRTFDRHHGPSGDPLILVAKGGSRDLNPTLPQRVIDRAMERDPVSASAEYLANFRSDIEGFASIEAIRGCLVGLIERPYTRGANYSAFVDPSGGSSDSMTLCIGHLDRPRQTVIVDLLREARPPFSPENVTQEFAKVLKSYSVHKVIGDRYAGEWPREQFQKFGIKYEPSAKPKSELYVDLLPLLNSRRIELLDNSKLFNQLVGLERRTARGGRDTIDHAPGGHDDLANAVAGVASSALNKPVINYRAWSDTKESDADAWRRLRLQTYLLSGGQRVLW